MGELRSKVRHILYKYLNDELVDDEFKRQMSEVIHEFEEKMPKRLLCQDIGLIVLERDQKSLAMSDKFKRIWVLIDQVQPQIKETPDHWKKAMSK